MTFPRDIYYRIELRSLGIGLPLYDPGLDPLHIPTMPELSSFAPAPTNPDDNRVRVGDVGHVNDNGRFIRAFNVFCSEGAGVNVHGVPKNFVSLPASVKEDVTCGTPHPAGAMHSHHVRAVGINGQLQVPGGYVLPLSRKRRVN